MKFSLRHALSILVPSAVYLTSDDGLKIVAWYSKDIPQPTQDIINQKIDELDKNYIDTKYSRDRKLEYSKLNQDELRYDDFVNNTTTWQDSIKAIKDKYPKPESGV